jgi:hypothetical protein
MLLGIPIIQEEPNLSLPLAKSTNQRVVHNSPSSTYIKKISIHYLYCFTEY